MLLTGGASASDEVRGRLGNDVLIGGDDGDHCHGGDGDDSMAGDHATFVVATRQLLSSFCDASSAPGGSDVLEAGAGDDLAIGGGGQDLLFGQLGADILIGGCNAGVAPLDASDRLDGGPGDDVLCGDSAFVVSRDVIIDLTLATAAAAASGSTAGGDDLLVGGADNDALYGQLGGDTLFGDSGNDLLVGGLGSDRMNGDDGDDVLLGDEGRLVRVNGVDRVLVLESVVRQTTSGELSSLGATTGSTTAARDELRAMFGSSSAFVALFGLHARDGTRSLDAAGAQWSIAATPMAFVDASGDDTLRGGAGDDLLVGQLGDDALNGDAGDDVLIGDDIDAELPTSLATRSLLALRVVRLFGAGSLPSLQLTTATPTFAASTSGWPATASLGNVGVAALQPDALLHTALAADATVLASGAIVSAVERADALPTLYVQAARRIVGLGADAARTLATFVADSAPPTSIAAMRGGLSALPSVAAAPYRQLLALVTLNARDAASAAAAPGNDRLVGQLGSDVLVGDSLIVRRTFGGALFATSSPLLLATQRASNAAVSVLSRAAVLSSDVARVQVLDFFCVALRYTSVRESSRGILIRFYRNERLKVLWDWALSVRQRCALLATS